MSNNNLAGNNAGKIRAAVAVTIVWVLATQYDCYRFIGGLHAMGVHPFVAFAAAYVVVFGLLGLAAWLVSPLATRLMGWRV